jgi:hypothetical protein
MSWERLPCNEIWLSSAAMTKTTLSAFVAAALVMASPAFAGGKACCAKSASNKAACSSFASLNLTADQKTKLDAWQAECMKAGCTKESRSAFLKKARGILSADQYAKLKTQCNQMGKKQA